jgi:hypothetical protein
MRIFYILLSILTLAGNCQAEPTDEDPYLPIVLAQFEMAQEKMDQIRKPNFSECDKLPKAEASACLKFYENIRNKKTIRMDYFIGYTNFENSFVGDPTEYRAVISYMTRECPDAQKQHSCGFKRDEFDANLLTKEVVWPDGQIKKFELHVENAALSTDDVANRESPAQALKSEETRNKFIRAAKESDILIYSGHSRYGGGPDFSPEYTGKGSHAAYYRKKRQGIQDLQNGLKNRTDSGPTLVVMSSCDSDLHFSQVLKTTPKGPKAAFLTASEVDTNESFRGNLEIQEAILGGTCPTKFPWETKFRFKTFH